MARIWSDSGELREESEEERGHEEEEALSLCDFPVNVVEDDVEEEQKQTLVASSGGKQPEEFEFGRRGSGSTFLRSEMCAAEDVFYQGQILPLRHSFCSNYDKVGNSVGPVGCGVNSYPATVSSTRSMDHDLQTPNSTWERVIVNCGIGRDGLYPEVQEHSSSSKSPSRSESMDRVLHSGFNSFSSRSSSSSSMSATKISWASSVSTGSDIAVSKKTNSKPKEVNLFQINHPSPKPQMLKHSNPGTQFSGSRNKPSSMWDFFKLGLVRTPELQDLKKIRAVGSVSRNSSSGSSSSSIANTNSNSKAVKSAEVSKEGRKQLGFFERRGGTMLSGCGCAVGAAVKPITLNHTIIKRENADPKKATAKTNDNKHRKKVIKKKETVEEPKQKEEEEGEGIGKHEMSRHRTFEWIKELSHAGYVHHHNNNRDMEEKEVVG